MVRDPFVTTEILEADLDKSPPSNIRVHLRYIERRTRRGERNIELSFQRAFLLPGSKRPGRQDLLVPSQKHG